MTLVRVLLFRPASPPPPLSHGSGAYLGALSSDLATSATGGGDGGAAATLSLGVSDVRLSCGGAWAYEEEVWPHFPRGSGEFDAAILGAGVTFATTLDRDAAHAPRAAMGADDCAPVAGEVTLDFHGGLTGWLLEELVPVLTPLLKVNLC